MKDGKLNMIIDMQFGSTGKGLFASYLANREYVDISVGNLSPNAGHTFKYNGEYAVTKQFPVCGILQTDSKIFLSSGSIINPLLLLEEIDKFNVSADRIVIHPNAAIIEDFHIHAESGKFSPQRRIASTMSGSGVALAYKVIRNTKLARDCEELKEFVKNFDLQAGLSYGYTALMETCQGFSLSLNSQFYPYVTSRNINVQSALNDVLVHPMYLGDVYGCMRTYPIRVGNTDDGYSGDFYDDSIEISFDDIGLAKEYTTNTNRVRRIATFSKQQYCDALTALKPDYVFLNFMNYADNQYTEDLMSFFEDIARFPDFYGYGRDIDDIYRVVKGI